MIRAAAHRMRFVSNELQTLVRCTMGESGFSRRGPSFDVFHDEAREVLQHAVLMLNDDEIHLVGDMLGEVIQERGWTCYACAVLPEHIHLLIRRHRDKAETMLNYLQDKTKQELIGAGRRPATHPVWGGPGWKVFQGTREDMERCIRYIEENPVKAGRPRQYWKFVKKYDGWMPAYRG
jgi:REP element-mobilizing transposase RayT